MAANSDVIWQVAVQAKNAANDAHGLGVLSALKRAGFEEVKSLRARRLYQIRGRLDQQAVEKLAGSLFCDPVIENWQCCEQISWPASDHVLVEVHLQPGVMDPVALSSTAAAQDLLADSDDCEVHEVRSGWQYELLGVDSLERVEALSRQVLANACIESVFISGLGRCDELPQHFPVSPVHPFKRQTVKLSGLTDEELATLSRQGHLFLSVEEMKTIAAHFESIGRDPTDLELETLAQTWSEHCVHKTLKSAVEYQGRGFGKDAESDKEVSKSYDNLIKETVFKATKELNKEWCWSVFEDNAGIIELDENQGVAFKVETHNHPSAIEPYGGSATGAGGCIRDILGVGLGAKPIANTDIFCVADPGFEGDRLPQGVLQPQRILRGIVSGVRDYGNRMGIPTVAGALHFDNRYLANPLVFCGCLGIIPRDKINKKPQPGDKVVVAGGRTGRDGIGGATFSSAELTDTHADEFAHAVQIGNAIEEKKVLDALLRARDHEKGCLYTAVNDCGAGGLSSAVGEMAEEIGAVVDLDKVPLKYSGLRYNEIWLSEAQERMVFSVPAENLDLLCRIFAEEGVETSVIGDFSSDGILELRYDGTEVGKLDVEFLFGGLPKRKRVARWTEPKPNLMPVKDGDKSGTVEETLLGKLGSLNTCSREEVFRQYDQEVQGATVIKALVGKGEGPSDAAVVRPLADGKTGVAIGCGLCPQEADRDPYWMAVKAVDEAVRNVVSVGADPARVAILDNFCWSSCEDEEQLGSLVRACQGCYDAAIAYETPFVSGKDSLNNQFSLSDDDASRLGLPSLISIPSTLLISAMGIVRDVGRCVTSDFKRPGNRVVWVSADVRKDGPEACAAMHRAVANLIGESAVAACHDVSDGGLAVCLAEMCIGGNAGASVSVDNGQVLFDESRSGYVLELNRAADLKALSDCSSLVELGLVDSDARLRIVSGEESMVDLSVKQLESTWRAPLGLSEGA